MKFPIAWLTLLVTAIPSIAQVYNFTRFTGVPYAGSRDGVGAAASFNLPSDVAVDGAGNVFVADYANHVIRKITATGVVSTLAGVAGQRGSTDGVGTLARFNYPRSLTVDQAGNVYVIDDSTIRKITAAGSVSTIAGRAGEPGSQDGPGSVARFALGLWDGAAGGIEADRDGTLYVADTGNHTIRKITPDGVVSTFAGSAGQAGDADGVAGAARFNSPMRLTLDRAGNVWVSDSRDWADWTLFLSGDPGPLGAIRRITPAGAVTTLVRTRTPSRDIAIDRSGNVYVTNFVDGDGNADNTISRISAGGAITPFVGDFPVPRDGSGNAAAFQFPQGLTIDENDNLFVADTRNHVIRKVTPEGQVTTFAGRLPASIDGGRDEARFKLVSWLGSSIATDNRGFVYLTDDYVIRKIAPDGSVTTLAGRAGEPGVADGTGSAARFDRINRLITDRAGNVFASDSGKLRKISPTGVVTTLRTDIGDGVIVADTTGAVSVFFTAPDFTSLPVVPVLKKITPQGTVSVVADRNAAVRVGSVYGMAIDSHDNLFVGASEGVILKIAPDGAITSFAGRPDVRPLQERQIVDGSIADARFISPRELAVDGADNLYVNDSGALRKISNGEVTTFFAAPFRNLSAWTVDRSGTIYTTSGQTVIKGVEATPGDPRSRLSNASILAKLDRQRPVIVGFNMPGDLRPILLRAVGPGLRDFAPGVTVANNPRLDVFGSTGAAIGSNDAWRGEASLAAAFQAVGAFPLLPASADSALLQTVSGTTTVRISSDTAGSSLVEVFALGSGDSSRLTNLSARHVIGDSADPSMTLGFTVVGSAAKSVLIRGIGPALAAPPFSLSPALSAGVLGVYSTSGELLAGAWGGDSHPILPIIAARVGAFPLAARATDPSIVLTLQPGSYTAVLSSAFRATPGEAMIEIYELP